MQRRNNKYKAVQIDAKLHHKIKLMAIEEGIEMRRFVSEMLVSAFANEHEIRRIIQKLKAR